MATDESEILAGVRSRRDVVRVALGELERALAAASSGRVDAWAATVHDAGVTLRKAFEEHIRGTECDDGLFGEVIERAPRLSHRVDELRRDHGTIEKSLTAFIDAAGSATDATLDSVRGLGVEVMGQIVRHRHMGSDLIYDAYMVDIEAGD